MDDVNIISSILDMFNVKFDKLRNEFQAYEKSQTAITNLEKEYSDYVLMSEIQDQIKKNTDDKVIHIDQPIDIEKLYDIKNFIHDVKRQGKMYKFRRLEIERNIKVIHLANTTYKRINVLVLYMRDHLLNNGVTLDELTKLETTITDQTEMLVFKDAEIIENQTKYTTDDYIAAYTNKILAKQWVIKLIEEQRRILIDVCRYTKLEYIRDNLQQSDKEDINKQHFNIAVVLAILFFSSSRNDRILNMYNFVEPLIDDVMP
jgi:hypothetical protein